jgi:hypothetical protein
MNEKLQLKFMLRRWKLIAARNDAVLQKNNFLK